MIDSLLLQWGRILLKGDAVTKFHNPDGSIKHVSLPAQKIWTRLGLVPASLELRIRRLRWLQQLANHRADN
eukprot:5841177-Pyramimonas_sp.AAC.1